MVNYACGFKQLETGKHFEWIIIHNINYSFGEWLLSIIDINQFVSTGPQPTSAESIHVQEYSSSK